MSKPTPGPWRVVNTKNEPYDGDYIADLSNDLLIVPPSIHFLGDPLADAALIAAAPELLAALERLLDAPRLGTHDAMRRATDAARAAIAKAQGGAA